MAEPWRWIDNADGTHVLVEGDDLLPLASTILMCGNVESSYQDRIASLPLLEAACESLDELQRFYGENAWEPDRMPGNDFYCEKAMVVVNLARSALARGRGA